MSDRVVIEDAFGNLWRAVACSDIESTHRNGRKIHDFPVVMVRITGGLLRRFRWWSPSNETVAWPAEYVYCGTDSGEGPIDLDVWPGWAIAASTGTTE